MANALVTGANRGIGLELCRQRRARGDHVIAVCRTHTSELESLGVHVASDVDVTSDESVARLAEHLSDPVDVLINNAGILTRETIEDLSFERIRRQFEVNTLGPLRLTAAL